MPRPAASLALEAICALCLLTAACAADDNGGTGGGSDSGREVGRDLGGLDGSFPDAGQDVAESDAGSDVFEDGAPEDQGTPDVSTEPDAAEPVCGALDQPCCAGTCDGSLVCSAGFCIADAATCTGEPACISPLGGLPDVPIVQRPGAPPLLAGGAITDGDYELDEIALYTDATVSALVDTFEVTSNGGTSGSLVFDGTDWGFEAQLDLYIDASAVGQSFAQNVQQALAAGGCYTAVGNELRGDLTQCGASWPDGAEPPDHLGYETAGDEIQLLLVLTRDMILAAVPADQQFLAGLAISGDLPVLLSFTRIP